MDGHGTGTSSKIEGSRMGIIDASQEPEQLLRTIACVGNKVQILIGATFS